MTARRSRSRLGPALAAVLSVVVLGCQGAGPSFDIAAVRASFAARCKTPTTSVKVNGQPTNFVVFCNNVKPEAVTANGSHLVVPTTLPAGAAPSGYGLGAYVNDPFADICDLLSEVHYDPTGGDLGYSYVDVLDANGGGQAGCNVLR